MRTELISIATNTLPLDGAFYLPEAEPCGAVLLYHGNTMNFYVGAPRFLPPVLTRLGFACLAFNRRGHDIPVPRISDVAYEHGLVDRILGCGTLVISDASEQGRVRLPDIPHVEQVQLKISDLLFAHTEPGPRGTGWQDERERRVDDGT